MACLYLRDCGEKLAGEMTVSKPKRKKLLTLRDKQKSLLHYDLYR